MRIHVYILSQNIQQAPTESVRLERILASRWSSSGNVDDNVRNMFRKSMVYISLSTCTTEDHALLRVCAAHASAAQAAQYLSR